MFQAGGNIRPKTGDRNTRVQSGKTRIHQVQIASDDGMSHHASWENFQSAKAKHKSKEDMDLPRKTVKSLVDFIDHQPIARTIVQPSCRPSRETHSTKKKVVMESDLTFPISKAIDVLKRQNRV